MDSDVLKVLGAVLLGGIITTGSTLFIEWWKACVFSRRLARAFRGEVLALSEIVDKRRYVEVVDSVIEHIEETEAPHNIRIPIRQHYFSVYTENVGNIGVLEDPLPERIASLYVKAKSFLDDLDALGSGLWDDKSVPKQLSFYRNLRAVLVESMEEARELVQKIDELYPSK